jgi:hypothetical protein
MYTTTQQAELEALGRRSANPRLSETLQGLDLGLSYEEIAELGDTTVENIRARAYDWRYGVGGKVPTGPDHARNVALVLRHVLGLDMTDGLRNAVTAHLTELAKVNREISVSTPARTGKLRRLGSRGLRVVQDFGPRCHFCTANHRGEC